MAALREGLPLRREDWREYLAWAVDCFRLCSAGARDETQIHTHMCYSEFGDILGAIAEMDADVISIETARSQMELLDVAFRKHPAAHWKKIFDERQMSADIIETYDFPKHDEMARDNRYILDLEDASLGKTSLLGFPIFMSETPAVLAHTAPRLGQHSFEILSDILGYAAEEVVRLAQQKVIA